MNPKLISAGIRALAHTWRVTCYGNAPQSPGIVAFWHDEMLPVWRSFAGKNAVGLTSLSNDGAALAALLNDWGYRLIRGSAARGGKEALQEAVEQARHSLVLMTPDGSRGPRHRMKPGAVIAAQRAGVPLYLCRITCSRGIRLQRSWDRFLIPFPFARIAMIFSEPLSPLDKPERAALDDRIRRCEDLLNCNPLDQYECAERERDLWPSARNGI